MVNNEKLLEKLSINLKAQKMILTSQVESLFIDAYKNDKNTIGFLEIKLNIKILRSLSSFVHKLKQQQQTK